MITFDDHRWYSIIYQDGKFLRAYAGGQEFSGLGVFETEEEFAKWRNEL
jgi:hypothetical protein